MKRTSPPPAGGSVRIIGGSLRSRRLRFHGGADLRPTPDRVRETLFNWLRDDIVGSRCLDLFAGSGALGFEAASRGAASVTLVERNPRAARSLSENAELLELTWVEIVCADARDFLLQPREPWDIVFLDPPFAGNALATSLRQLVDGGRLQPGALVYTEQPRRDDPPNSREGWKCLKQGLYGDVRFSLSRCVEPARHGAG